MTGLDGLQLRLVGVGGRHAVRWHWLSLRHEEAFTCGALIPEVVLMLMSLNASLATVLSAMKCCYSCSQYEPYYTPSTLMKLTAPLLYHSRSGDMIFQQCPQGRSGQDRTRKSPY